MRLRMLLPLSVLLHLLALFVAPSLAIEVRFVRQGTKVPLFLQEHASPTWSFQTTVQGSAVVLGSTVLGNANSDVLIGTADLAGNLLDVETIPGFGTTRRSADGSLMVLASIWTGQSFEFGDSTVTAVDELDILLARFHPDHTLDWLQILAGPGIDSGSALSWADDGTAVVLGTFSANLTIGSETLVAPAPDTHFLASFDDDGMVQWTHTMTGGTAVGAQGDVLFDSNGDLIVTQSFAQTGLVGDSLLTCMSQRDLYVAKLSSAGDFQWIRHISGSGPGGYATPYDLTSDTSGNIYLGGGTTGAFDFGNGHATSDSSDGFVAKLDTQGATQWLFKAPATSAWVRSIDLAPDGGIAVTGTSSLDRHFGFINLPWANGPNVFVGMLNPDGTARWALGAAGDTRSTGIEVMAVGVDDVLLNASMWMEAFFAGHHLIADDGHVFTARLTDRLTTHTPAPRPELRLDSHPNPFNPTTTVLIEHAIAGNVRLAVHDVRGHHVVTLFEGWSDAGTRSIGWDGRNHAGQTMASGVYLLQLEAAGHSITRRIVLLR